MRKLLPLSLALLLALVVSVAQATPLEELTDLAEYYPEDTLVYATIRTDDGYIETLDGVLALVAQNLGEAVPIEGVTVEQLLNLVSFSVLRGSYDSTLNSWLGDRVAIGVYDLGLETGIPSGMVALAVEDRTGAETFLSASLPELTMTDAEEYTVFADAAGTEFAVINDDVMLLALEDGLVVEAIEGYDNTLAAAEGFITAYESLPEDAYNIYVYANAGQVNAANVESTAQQLEMLDLDIFGGLVTGLLNMSMANSEGAVAGVGFTILDGRTLAIDSVGVTSEAAAAATREMMGYVEQNPISLDFAQFVPGNAQLVIHDNALGPDALAIFGLLDNVAPSVQQLIDLVLADDELLDELDLDDPMLQELAGMLDVSGLRLGGMILNQITPSIAGLTGLNLEDEILAWMTGDYALWASLLPVRTDLDFTFDLGLAVENTDPEAAAYIVERMTEVMDAYRRAYETETIGGGESLVLKAPVRGLLTLAGLPTDMLDKTTELDLIIGSNDAIYTVSSRYGAEFALEPTDDSLANQPAFAYAAEALLLADPVMVWYIGIPEIVAALPSMQNVLDVNDQDMQMAQFFLSQVESLTISASAPDDVTTLTRLTITLPDGVDMPMMVEEMEDAETEAEEVVEAIVTEEPGTIVDIAAGNDDFSILVAALQAVDGAVEVLSDDSQEFTVFAPTNAAFEALLAELGLSADDLLASGQLSDILSYHVVLGTFPAEDVIGLDGESIPTGLDGAEISISVVDGDVVLNDSVNVVMTDIIASNGVIHVVDAVLLPPMDSADMEAEEVEDAEEEATPEPATTEEAE